MIDGACDFQRIVERTDDPLLDVRDLTVSFATEGEAVLAVEGLDFHVGRGEVLGIVGESGAGKSVSALAVMGLLPDGAQVSGSIRFRGRQLLGLDDRALCRMRGHDMAIIFQDPLSCLTPSYTVGAQVAEAVRTHRRCTRAQASARALELLDLIGFPEPRLRARSFPHELSGGMRQRVLIAMAMAHDPALIVADEPTAALDVTIQAQVLQVLADAKERTGAAIIVITHDLAVVAGLADRVLVMSGGRSVESGEVDRIFHAPEMPYTQKLLASLPPAKALARPGPALHQRHRGEVVLEVRDLGRHFRRPRGRRGRLALATTRAVDGVSFDIRRGETLALVGESGCGKTTTIREVLTLARPAHGSIVVLGRDTSELDDKGRRALRRRMGAVFQDPVTSLDPRMPVAEIVGEGLRAFGATRERRERRTEELLKQVGLDREFARRYPGELSGGQRQRVAIARALALEPELVVLDEPVSALDAPVRVEVLRLLDRLQAGLGLAYLFVTHDLSLVGQIADRVAVMYLGRIVEVGTTSAVFAGAAHPYTQALLSSVPVADPRQERMRQRLLVAGEPASLTGIDRGCRFRSRCATFATFGADLAARCLEEQPVLAGQGEDHQAACHHAEPRWTLGPDQRQVRSVHQDEHRPGEREEP